MSNLKKKSSETANLKNFDTSSFFSFIIQGIQSRKNSSGSILNGHHFSFQFESHSGFFFEEIAVFWHPKILEISLKLGKVDQRVIHCPTKIGKYWCTSNLTSKKFFWLKGGLFQRDSTLKRACPLYLRITYILRSTHRKRPWKHY